MAGALILLLVQGALGAIDTLWYHERVYALPLRAPQTSPELRLHAARDFVYGVMFLTLPFVRWAGWWAWVLALLLAAEIVITLTDFVIEDRIRAPYGGVAKGERTMHTIMAIVYGAFLAQFLPQLLKASAWTAGFEPHDALTGPLRWVLAAMGVGVLLSGIRDLCAANGWGVFALPFQSPTGQSPGT